MSLEPGQRIAATQGHSGAFRTVQQARCNFRVAPFDLVTGEETAEDELVATEFLHDIRSDKPGTADDDQSWPGVGRLGYNGGMAYNEFTLDVLLHQFGLRLREQAGYFGGVAAAAISVRLREALDDGLPLASAIGTEKARSEFVIAPVLDEVRRQCLGRISLFSGVDFTVDFDRGLRGTCDFLFSLSPLQSTVQAPVVAVVEAKNDSLKSGLGQCAAEMLAAQTFNERRGRPLPAVFGVVTTGSDWKFLRLEGDELTLDLAEYQISQAERIVGILLAMVAEPLGV